MTQRRVYTDPSDKLWVEIPELNDGTLQSITEMKRYRRREESAVMTPSMPARERACALRLGGVLRGERRPDSRRWLLCAAALLLVTGCATAPPVGQRDLLAFVTDGVTTKSDIYLRLGPPGREFEGGRIATWRVAEDEGGYYVVASSTETWRGSRHELVVVFGANGRVERHSFVRLR